MLKAKTPIDIIGMQVSGNVSEFTPYKKPSGASKKQESTISVENGFSINVRSIGKIFQLFARNVQEKNRWLTVLENVAVAKKFDL